MESETKEEIHTLPSPVQINYQDRQMDFVQISPSEIDYLTETSLPFQISLGLATTFLGAGLGINISYLASNTPDGALKGYFILCYIVAVALGAISYLLFNNMNKMKQRIINKK